MMTPEQTKWVQSVMASAGGAAPAGASPPAEAPAAPGPSGDALPQPMLPDCKPVHGQVPGPKNFVLCAMHGHILDTDKKLIVAHTLKEFEAQHPGMGKLPAPMLPDCAIVRGKVPGPKHHVLCGTHGHVLDEDKKQIIAHTLAEYAKQHAGGKAGAGGGAAHGGAKHADPKAAGGAPNADAAAPADPAQALSDLAGKVGDAATALATSLKGLLDFEWNTSKDGCAAEMADLQKPVDALQKKLGVLQDYAVAIGRGGGHDKGEDRGLELFLACRSAEESIDALAAVFDKDALGACMARRDSTYRTDTGTGDGAVAKAAKHYADSRGNISSSMEALLGKLNEVRRWGKKNHLTFQW